MRPIPRERTRGGGPSALRYHLWFFLRKDGSGIEILPAARFPPPLSLLEAEKGFVALISPGSIAAPPGNWTEAEHAILLEGGFCPEHAILAKGEDFWVFDGCSAKGPLFPPSACLDPSQTVISESQLCVYCATLFLMWFQIPPSPFQHRICHTPLAPLTSPQIPCNHLFFPQGIKGRDAPPFFFSACFALFWCFFLSANDQNMIFIYDLF